MKESRHWLNEARQLCDELCHEDGLDPRILARSFETKTKTHKNQQLCKKAQHALSLVLAGNVGDPVLQNLEVTEVRSDEHRQFLIVSVRHLDLGLAADEHKTLDKLQAIQGYLRSSIARSVKRKRVPALKFKMLRILNEVNGYAYSSNN